MFAAFLAVSVSEPGARVWPIDSADGTPVETNVLAQSNWLVAAYAIWLYHEYPLSIDCSPPRACYAKSQLVNYHFNCVRGFIYVRERISMDLNGNVVNHQVFEQPTPTSPLDAGVRDGFGHLCRSSADADDFPWRRD